MLAVLPYSPDADPTPRLGELPEPEPEPGEVRLRVAATALNRADLLQLRGLYPPPPGESDVPGLECAGVIDKLGAGVAGWREGERVMALLAGGGHAERVSVPATQLLRIPDSLSFEEAAALPEVAITSWTNLVSEGRLEAGQSVLITAATSGVGTFAVQLARELGARVLVAGRSLDRLHELRPLGAEICVELTDDLPQRVREANGGRGVDLVMDMTGGRFTGLALEALARRGTLVLVGIMAGARTEVDLADVLRRRLRMVGSVLRSRSREEKARLVADFAAFAGGRLTNGRLKPQIDQVFAFTEMAEAYARMERGGHLGKLVLKVS